MLLSLPASWVNLRPVSCAFVEYVTEVRPSLSYLRLKDFPRFAVLLLITVTSSVHKIIMRTMIRPCNCCSAECATLCQQRKPQGKAFGLFRKTLQINMGCDRIA
eukprot:scpid86674/ scgid27585/ 